MGGRRPPRFEQRSLNPASRGLRQLAQRLFGKRFVHRHRVHRVRIGDATFKRIRFGDVARAEQAERALEHFEGSAALPRLYARFDDELLVEFVDGERLARIDGACADALARFHAAVHRGGHRLVPAAQSGVLERVERDLALLQRTGVIETGAAGALRAARDRLAPSALRVGWDYTDGVAKNFVWRDDTTLVGIDVESLAADALVGTGIAKSLSRGDRELRPRLLEAYTRASGADLEKELPFVELCGELRWLVNRLLKGSRIEPGRLERFLG